MVCSPFRADGSAVQAQTEREHYRQSHWQDVHHEKGSDQLKLCAVSLREGWSLITTMSWHKSLGTVEVIAEMQVIPTLIQECTRERQACRTPEYSRSDWTPGYESFSFKMNAIQISFTHLKLSLPVCKTWYQGQEIMCQARQTRHVLGWIKWKYNSQYPTFGSPQNWQFLLYF